jgi:hypothetical protein
MILSIFHRTQFESKSNLVKCTIGFPSTLDFFLQSTKTLFEICDLLKYICGTSFSCSIDLRIVASS